LNTIIDFKGRRVEAHNTWPAAIEFRAEADFNKLVHANAGRAPFEPIQLQPNGDPEYQTCVGHLIDGLDALPLRPDYFFDHCFRVLDHATATIAPNKGIEGVMEKLPARLLAIDSALWTDIVDLLGQSMPRVTLDLLARRLLQAETAGRPKLEGLKKRAPKILGTGFYNDFCQKYLHDEHGNPLPTLGESISLAGRFFRLFLSGKAGTRTKAASHSELDLRGKIVGAEKRMQVVLSLLLFNARNERAHGAVISPFRTSKATADRYESYYFMALTTYIFALGSLAVRFPNQSVTSAAIAAGLKKNLDLQTAFFAAT
jgi:hypothetical protein